MYNLNSTRGKPVVNALTPSVACHNGNGSEEAGVRTQHDNSRETISCCIMSGDDELAKRLLKRADRILNEVDEAYIIKQRGHRQRAMPVFRPEELSLGKTLGTGGFGIVSEIAKFTLDPDLPPEELPVTTGDGPSAIILDNDKEGGDSNASILDNPQQPNHNIYRTFSLHDKIPGSFVEVVDRTEESNMNDHVHYDVKKARHFMAKRCMRNGKARFAIKRLHGDLSPVEKVRGMIDLAIEAKYLSTVWHPNISKCCVCWGAGCHDDELSSSSFS